MYWESVHYLIYARVGLKQKYLELYQVHWTSYDAHWPNIPWSEILCQRPPTWVLKLNKLQTLVRLLWLYLSIGYFVPDTIKSEGNRRIRCRLKKAFLIGSDRGCKRILELHIHGVSITRLFITPKILTIDHVNVAEILAEKKRIWFSFTAYNSLTSYGSQLQRIRTSKPTDQGRSNLGVVYWVVWFHVWKWTWFWEYIDIHFVHYTCMYMYIHRTLYTYHAELLDIWYDVKQKNCETNMSLYT